MWKSVVSIGLFCSLFLAVLCLASKWGSKSAKLDAIKEEIKQKAREQERANAINKRVDDMPIDYVRKRLQDTKHD